MTVPEPVELTSREYAIIRGLASGLTLSQITTRIGRVRSVISRDMAHLRDPLPAGHATIADSATVIALRRRALNASLAGYQRPRRTGRRAA